MNIGKIAIITMALAIAILDAPLTTVPSYAGNSIMVRPRWRRPHGASRHLDRKWHDARIAAGDCNL
jgi:hypothetical protein